MKKFLAPVAIIALVTLFMSARYVTPADSRTGFQAPNFTVANAQGALSLQELRGNYTLVTFWSSTDAQSRLANRQYDRLTASTDGHVRHLAVNLDPSEGVFTQLVTLDGLDSNAQYHAQGDEAQHLAQVWRLDSGYNSYLVDPDGTIIAINPNPIDILTL